MSVCEGVICLGIYQMQPHELQLVYNPLSRISFERKTQKSKSFENLACCVFVCVSTALPSFWGLFLAIFCTTVDRHFECHVLNRRKGRK